ncbi:MAG: carbohydrate ABC transporter substrate-binding protein, partial [Clostridiales bacterium]|nr:carbohydrate ABC transporter substrate-binding protein [Clostridiales bacterium]
GLMYFTTYASRGTVVMAYDLGDGSGRQLDLEFDSEEYINGLCAYRDGQLLSMRSHWREDGVTVTVAVIDPEAEESEDLFAIPTVGYSNPGSIAYSEERDALYYIMNGELFQITGMDVSTNQAVADMPVEPYSESAPILTAEGLFIASSYEAVVRRNTDPNLRAEKRLKVQNQYNQSVDSAYYAFTNKHGDVEVVLTQQVEDVVQAMMNRSAAVDVYCLYASSAEYGAVFSRGYMAELTGSEVIAGVVNGMYPAFKDWCVKDGEIVALPVELYFTTRGYNPKAFEKAGLTEEDVPTTWIGLFEMLEPLAERMKDYPNMSVFEPYYTKSMLKRELFQHMLLDYMVYIGRPGNEYKFDTPMFRALMDAYLAVDFDALELPEDDEDYQTRVYAVRADGDMETSALFSGYADISARTYALTSGQKPLLLALSEGVEPKVMGELCVVFVNPFSEHRKDAIAFVEEIARSLDDVLRIHILPTENEPVLDPYYESNLKSWADTIATVKAQLEQAPEDEKKAFEDMIAEYEGYRKEYEENYMYSASEASIAKYREFADKLQVMPYLGLGNDNTEEFYTLVSQFTDGLIDADAFIKNVDRKLQMMMLEGQ